MLVNRLKGLSIFYYLLCDQPHSSCDLGATYTCMYLHTYTHAYVGYDIMQAYTHVHILLCNTLWTHRMWSYNVLNSVMSYYHLILSSHSIARTNITYLRWNRPFRGWAGLGWDHRRDEGLGVRTGVARCVRAEDLSGWCTAESVHACVVWVTTGDRGAVLW